MAAGAEPGQSDWLTGLPQMPFVFAGGGVISPDAAEPMMKASFSMMKMYPGGENMTEEQFRKVIEISVRSMQGMRSMGMMMGVGEGDEPLYSSMYLVIKMDDAERYMDDYLNAVREMAKIFGDGKFPFSYDIEPMQIEGRRGVQLSMGMKGSSASKRFRGRRRSWR